MKLTNEFQPIRNWAEQKGIFKSGDTKTQLIKLMEEVGELSNATIRSNREEVKDAIGDCVVVLTNLAELHHMSIESCVNEAYEVIKNRSGKMVNGSFRKDEI